MKTVLVLGSGGQLGMSISKVLCEKEYKNKWVLLSRQEADITNPDRLRKIFEDAKPDVVVNCGAYTNVEKAEDERDEALMVNVQGTENLAKLCQQYGSHFIHISTDYVFDGRKNVPYDESDVPNPINWYGYTKWSGERVAISNAENLTILRVSGLYSPWRKNFVKTMINLAIKRREMRVVYDQIHCPVSALFVANELVRTIENDIVPRGIYHLTNDGITSWYDFARKIIELSGLKANIVPIRTHEFPTRAKRPAYSVLSNRKWKETTGAKTIHWEEDLYNVLRMSEMWENV